MAGIWKATLSIFVFLIALCLGNQAPHAKEPITWMISDYPPIGIAHGPLAERGVADLIARMIAEELPHIDHRFERANVKRMMVELERGNRVCIPGLIKTKEREKSMHFTKLPIMLLTPLGMIIRKKDRSLFGGSDVVSLEDIIQNRNLRLGLVEGITLGGKLDEIVRRHRNEEHLYFDRGSGLIRSRLLMLAHGRFDYTVSYPWMLVYHRRELEELGQLEVLKLRESTTPIIWFAACPKNEWGAATTRKIDHVLARLRPTKEYRGTLEAWIPRESLVEFRDQYDTIFLPMK